MNLGADRVLVDTNVVVYSLVGSPLAERFASYLVGSSLLVSFQTVGELYAIAMRRGWADRRWLRLESHLARFLVVYPSAEIVHAWARVMSSQLRLGQPVQAKDAWLAATALVYDRPVVTNHRRDFERIEGVRLLPAS